VSSAGKLVVLVVDSDNDVGETLGQKTPIIGEERVKSAAVEFAVKRPEDSDLNAMFAALSLYYELKERGWNVEVAVLGGDAKDSVKASIKVSEEAEEVKKATGASSAIVVTDGPSDEALLALISSRIRVVGAKHVIVEQWRGVEVTYALIAKYLKKALTEERYARLFLGVPGLLVVLVAALKMLGLLEYALALAGVVVGGAMVVRGFGLESRIREYWASSPVMFVSSLLATVLLIAGAWLLAEALGGEGLSVRSLGTALASSAPLFGLAAFSVFAGKSIVKLLHRDVKVWHDVIGMVLSIVFVVSFSSLGEALAQLPPGAGAQQILSAVMRSGFVEWMLAGLGASGVLAAVAAFLEKRSSSRGHSATST